MNIDPINPIIDNTDEVYFSVDSHSTDRAQFQFKVARQSHIREAKRILRNAERYQTRSNQFANRLLDFEAFNPNANTKKIVAQAIRLALQSIPSQPLQSSWYDQPFTQLAPEYVLTFKNEIEIITEPPAVPSSLIVRTETTGDYWRIEVVPGARSRQIQIFGSIGNIIRYTQTISSNTVEVEYFTNTFGPIEPVIFRARAINQIGESAETPDVITYPFYQPRTPFLLQFVRRQGTTVTLRVGVSGDLTSITVLASRDTIPEKDNAQAGGRTDLSIGIPVRYDSGTIVEVQITGITTGNWYARAFTQNAHRESELSTEVNFF